MSARPFDATVRAWLTSEAPAEAPGWLVDEAVEQALALPRARRRGLRVRPARLAAPVAAAMLLAGAFAALLLLRSPDASGPAGGAPSVHAFAVDAVRLPVEVAVIDGAIWVGDGLLPGAEAFDFSGHSLVTVQTQREVPPPSLSRHALLSDVVAAFGSVWTVEEELGTVTRLEPVSGRQLASIAVAPYPHAAAEAAGALWLVSPTSGVVVRIDPATNSASVATSFRPAEDLGAAIVGDGRGIWVALGDRLLRIDAGSGSPLAELSVPGVVDVALGDDLWVATSDSVQRRDALTGDLLATVPIRPDAIAIAGGLVWLADPAAGGVRGLDPATTEVVHEVALDIRPTALAASGTTLVALDEVARRVAVIGFGDPTPEERP